MLNRRQQGEVTILTIDRSNRRNALGTELMQAFSGAFVELGHFGLLPGFCFYGLQRGYCAQ